MATDDPQRARVYVLERHEFGGHFRHVVPMKVLRRAVRKLSKSYDVPPITLSVRRIRGAGGEYDADTGSVTLCPVVGRNLASLAHEFAHHIAWVRHGHHCQDHGPRFMLYYAQCLSSLRLVPMAGTRAACKRYKVSMARA